MRVRALPCLLVASLLAAATVASGVPSATAQATGAAGSASGVTADVTLTGAQRATIGPVPHAEVAPTTAPASDRRTAPLVTLPDVVTTGLAVASAAADPLADTATGAADVPGVTLVSGLVTAPTVSSACDVSPVAATATTTLADADAGLPHLPRTALDARPAPNTTVDVRTAAGDVVAHLVLNEQHVGVAGGVRTLTVNALHLTLVGGVPGSLGTGDVVVGTSTCRILRPGTPSVTSVSPSSGSTAGGTLVTVTGTNLVGATRVTVGGAPAPFAVTSPTTITLVTRAHAAGVADIAVTGPGGTSANTPADDFRHVAPPEVTGLSPRRGLEAGGTTVTITGSRLTGTLAVYFGLRPATGVRVVDDGHVTAVSPAGIGTVDVTVVTPSGVSAVTPATRFTYVPGPPSITALLPSGGLTTGGATVVLYGTNLTPDTTVTISGTTVPTQFYAPGIVQFVTPPHAAGNVEVTATTPRGTSNALQFTYFAAPTVTGFGPDTGPVTGGTVVTVTGTNLDGVGEVTFDHTPGVVQARTPTALRVVSPAHAPGPVGLTASGPGGAVVPVGTFTYAGPLPPPGEPAVTGLSPDQGPAGGGTTVTVTGNSLTGASVVHFGPNPATHVTVVDDSRVTAVSPTGIPGPVSVTVTTPAGTTPVTPESTFTYLPDTPPTVTAVSPGRGPQTGGTTVTVRGTNFTLDAAVSVDGRPVVQQVVDDTTITFTTPPGNPGPADVVVTNAAGPSAPATFTYVAVPRVTGLSPSFGPTTGGTTVTVTGTGLSGVTTASVGGIAATVTSRTDTRLVLTTPPRRPAGPAEVLLFGPDAVQTTAGTFVFQAVPPTITRVDPDRGPTSGGTRITITGTDLTGTSQVLVDGVPATDVTVVDDGHVTAVTGASPVTGRVPLVLTTAAGEATGSFTYVPAPTVVGLAPSIGPTAGGTAVTIHGTDLDTADQVTFGGVPATSFRVVAPGRVVAVTPPHAAGTVEVAVRTAGGRATGRFTYRRRPTVTALTPDSGPTTGGTSVRLTGTDLRGTYAVTFGGVPAASFDRLSDTVVVAVTPPHAAGRVPVVVETPGGVSAPPGFTFVPAPTGRPVVTSVSPGYGPARGGTRVTVTGSGFTAGTRVTFGRVPARHVVVDPGGRRLTAVTPPHGPGMVDVTVTTPHGSTTVRDAFEYVPECHARPCGGHHDHHGGRHGHSDAGGAGGAGGDGGPHRHHAHHRGDTAGALGGAGGRGGYDGAPPDHQHGRPGAQHGPRPGRGLAFTGPQVATGIGVGAVAAGLLLLLLARLARRGRTARRHGTPG